MHPERQPGGGSIALGDRGGRRRGGDRHARRVPGEGLRRCARRPSRRIGRPVQRCGTRATGDSSTTASEQECGRWCRANRCSRRAIISCLPIHPGLAGFHRPHFGTEPIAPPDRSCGGDRDGDGVGRSALGADGAELLWRNRPGDRPRPSAAAGRGVPDRSAWTVPEAIQRR